jgi:hypothetical protein
VIPGVFCEAPGDEQASEDLGERARGLTGIPMLNEGMAVLIIANVLRLLRAHPTER